MQHAPLPPSSAERWLACAGSPQAEQAEGERVSTSFAEQGHIAHALFAVALRDNVSPFQLTPSPVLAVPLQLAASRAGQLIAGRRFLVEQRLPALPGLPGIWGTTDVVVFDQYGRVVVIIDLKFGRGVMVEADTVQVAIYALLAAQKFGGAPGGITAWILQPRIPHPQGFARSHHYTTAALDALVPRLRQAAIATAQPAAPRRSGPWCRFCAARGTCATYRRAPPPPPTASAQPRIWGQVAHG